MRRTSTMAAAAMLILAACGSATAGTAPTSSAARAPTATAAAAIATTADHTGHTGTSAPATAQAVPAAQPVAQGATPSATAAAGTPAGNAASPEPATPAPTPTPTQATVTLPPTVAPITAPPASGVTIAVTLTDSAVRLSRSSAPAGTVTFNVTNGGSTRHEFVVLKTDLPQGQLPTDPAQPALVLEPGFLGKVAALQPHASGSITLTLTSGNYVLICNELAHYMIGMHSAFTVN